MKAWEERSCLNGSFLSLSSPGQGRDCVWLFMSVWESERVCGETHRPLLLLGLRWLSLVRFYYTHMHASARTLFRTPPWAARTEKKTLLQGRFGKWGVLHTIAVSSFITASQASTRHETASDIFFVQKLTDMFGLNNSCDVVLYWLYTYI